MPSDQRDSVSLRSGNTWSVCALVHPGLLRIAASSISSTDYVVGATVGHFLETALADDFRAVADFVRPFDLASAFGVAVFASAEFLVADDFRLAATPVLETPTDTATVPVFVDFAELRGPRRVERVVAAAVSCFGCAVRLAARLVPESVALAEIEAVALTLPEA